MTTDHSRSLGPWHVSPIGLGTMPMSIEGRPDRGRAIATIHAALEAGISLIDTADAYYRAGEEMGHNEILVAKALASYPGDVTGVVVSTKGGHYRSADGGWPVDGRPGRLIDAALASRARLGVERIDLYHLHRPDPAVPFESSVGALEQLLEDGVVYRVGLSNVSQDQISWAARQLGERLVSVQNQLSPVFRSSLPELELCNRLGIAFLPWRPLGGLTYDRDPTRLAPFVAVAEQVGASAYAVCLAWLLAQGSHVIPIPGSTRPETILDSLHGVDLKLTHEQLSQLNAA
jgi:aryl-alcohol dehydrogenase-like predicted oxidoreductase